MKNTVSQCVEKLKSAARGTATGCDTEIGHPFASIPLYVTVYQPAAVNRCVGFVRTEVLLTPLAGSPKFQPVAVTPPPVVPLNVTGLQMGIVMVKSIVPTGMHGDVPQGPSDITITLDVAVQLFASVTTTVYEPVAIAVYVLELVPTGELFRYH